ncbi:MAG: RraA family protein [Candidatus Rokubacteria bacterium]|nr:RraA family protein [Candidatus Rokubacteria bacterium]MBI3827380.1 RraA family protein [Candidatus Rokubacteria bacterium]
MDITAFARISPCTFAEVVTRDRVMDHGMKPLYPDMPRLVGPAYPVECPPGDNLMLHVAIHRAPEGSVIVCKAGDSNWAMAGGNVCAYAQQRGVAGLVVDGVIRDLAETRSNRFPVIARGVVPKPGVRKQVGTLNGPVVCGGVRVEPGDLVVGDEEGVVVVPAARAKEILEAAQARADNDAQTPLEAWVANHKKNIDAALAELGFTG